MKNRLSALLAAGLAFSACDDKKPEPEVAVSAAAIEVPEFVISAAAEDVKKGEALFAAKGCSSCHKLGGGKLVGPDLAGVTTRRDEKWIERMILRPEVMVKDDEVAKKLLGEFFVPMPNQNVDPANELPYLMSFLKHAPR